MWALLRNQMANRRDKRMQRGIRGPSSRRNAQALISEEEVGADWFIPSKAVKMGELLGSGAFGEVHRCTVDGMPTESLVAKRVMTNRLKPADLPMLRQEILLSTRLNHPNTVKVGLDRLFPST